jgi:tRNA A-37 threonylcarbamoyl transferase component Bud32
MTMIAHGSIFLSYAREQERIVEDVAVKLRARGYTVFFDKKSLKGELFHERIRREVETCQLFVFFVSFASLNSRSFALTELSYAEARWPNPGGHVLALKADDVEIERVPAYLRALVDIQSIEGDFPTGAFDRIVRMAGAAAGTRHGQEAGAGDEKSISECAAALVDALSKRRKLPPTGVATGEVIGTIDGLVRSIKSRFRPDEGSIVAGARLVKVIGVGNFGTVWEGFDSELKRPVAVKIFRMERLAEGQMLFRFRKSIRAMRLLSETKRIDSMPEAEGTIVAFVRADSTDLAFSMELLTGGNLEDVSKYGWSLDYKLDLVSRVALAVAYSHKNGVIHRDIKPANVVLNGMGQALLTDFDIADVRFTTSMSTTVEGGLGTPVFAAPEQLLDAERADERSDVYSLGRLMQYMLLERSPGYQIEKDPALETLSTFPPAIVAVVRKATQFDPGRRFNSARELERALVACRTGAAAWQARRMQVVRWARHHWAVIVIVGLLLGTSAYAVTYQTRVAAREAAFRRDEERLRLQLETLSSKLSESIQRKDEATDRVTRLKAELDALTKLPPSKETDSKVAEARRRLAAAERTLTDIEALQNELQAEFVHAKRTPQARRRAEDAPKKLAAPVDSAADSADAFVREHNVAVDDMLSLIAKRANRRCSSAGMTETGKVHVTFGISGTPVAVVAHGFSDDVARCVREAFQGASMAPLGYTVAYWRTVAIGQCNCAPDDLACGMRCSTKTRPATSKQTEVEAPAAQTAAE